MKFLGACLLCLWYTGNVLGKNRKYYIGIKEINWDYAPSGKNIISGKSIADDVYASKYLQTAPMRIGRVYKKAVYVQYTNGSYTEEIKKPDWLGYLGPIITAEVGDTLTIVLKNFASRPYSMHPVGVQYTKANEGALYPDNTSGAEKKDDFVEPGESYTYQWEVVPDQGPSVMDDYCVVRLYHSHLNPARDIYSGLVGQFIICKEGVLKDKKSKNRYKEFILMFSVVDENLSWYLDDNINTYCSDPVEKDDEDFIESNKMHSINGYMFGNLPGLSMCDNTQVMWYMIGTGNEVDIHSVNFHGEVLTHQYFRVDTLNVFPSTMIQATMSPKNPGKWLLSCKVADHWEAGMQAIYEVENCTGLNNCSSDSNVRHYYIAAEEIIWNYGPTSINQFTFKNLDDPGSESAKYFIQNQTRIGGSYKKAVYIEYTDGNFTKKKEISREEDHLGLLGPIIWAEVGDMIKVTFKNNASRPYSIQAHGVSYKKCMEGAVYETGNVSKANLTTEEPDQVSEANRVEPGDTFTYEWHVPYRVGPALHDINCIPWLYYSSVDVVRDPYSGLVGPLLVCLSLSQGKPTDVDRNLFIMPTVFDENKSWYLDENILRITDNPQNVDKEDPDFQESNMMHSINGYMYGNLAGLYMCEGDLVLWHMLGLGTEVDMHGIHFTGNTIKIRETTRDVASLFPHISYSVTMNPDKVGFFDVECLTADHYTGGMRQHYMVQPCYQKNSTKKHFRNVTYYIAAEEMEWDYSPNRTWEHLWSSVHNDIPGDIYLNRSRTTIGSKYKKVVYREYHDDTFTVRAKRTKEQEHLALMGPLLRASVGDRIRIVFKNMASRPYSIYAHGVKTEENDVTPTEPGMVQTYVWDVVERSGPYKQEKYCLTWAYYSTVDRVKDIYSGLIGPLVVCKKGYFPHMMLTEPVVRFALFFMVLDENKSWYLDENIQTYCLNPEEVDKSDANFIESNKMHSINGLMYSNLNGLTMHVDETINWHLIVLGNEVDIHTIHFHGNSFKYSRGEVYQNDVYESFPGTFQTVAMIAKSPGTWLLHCQVTDHMMAGMETVYTVLP
ncbi:ceruloplasmin-like [Hyla sarda]|uniref:ceruloplasmin-like n=1 Tax=Hyla sarda TaxID=327740 RepID=UPI0024C2D1A9|nr:ceruloplasmin-like [Hyla sarda]